MNYHCYTLFEGDRCPVCGSTRVREAQDENRRKGIPNVYVINGTLLWQMPDGSITTVDPMRPANLATKPSNNETTGKVQA